jgi:hypothetical protein
MSSYLARLDDPLGTGLTAEQVAIAQSNEASVILAVHEHFLWSRLLAEQERLDAEAAADAKWSALEQELVFLHKGLALAGRSATGVELVARSVEQLARAGEQRFRRRFGG